MHSNISEVEVDYAIAVEHVIVHTIVKEYSYDISTRAYLKPSDIGEVN